MEGKIVEISTLNILAIGRLLWETMYLYALTQPWPEHEVLVCGQDGVQVSQQVNEDQCVLVQQLQVVLVVGLDGPVVPNRS